MTPLQARILFILGNPVEVAPGSPEVRAAFDGLLELGMLDLSNFYDLYVVTPKGVTWCERALATPMPTQEWGYE